MARAELRQKFVAYAVDGDEMFGGVAGIAELFTELNDDLVESAGGAVIVVAPHFVEEFVAGKDLAGMSVEKLQQLEFARGEFLSRFATANLKLLRVYCGIPDLEGTVGRGFFRWRLSAAKQSMNARDELADAERFGDVIVRTGIQADNF